MRPIAGVETKITLAAVRLTVATINKRRARKPGARVPFAAWCAELFVARAAS